MKSWSKFCEWAEPAFRSFSFEDLLMGYHYYNEGVVRNLSSFSWGLVTPAGTYYLMINDINMYLRTVGNMYDYNGDESINHEQAEWRFYKNDETKVKDEMTLVNFINSEKLGLTIMKYDKSQGVFGILEVEEFNGRKISKITFCSYN